MNLAQPIDKKKEEPYVRGQHSCANTLIVRVWCFLKKVAPFCTVKCVYSNILGRYYMISITENARKELEAYFADKEKGTIRVYLAPGG